MPNLADLREKRSKLYADLTQMGKVDAPTIETRAAFDTAAADLDILDADIKRAERVEAMEQETRSRQGNRPQPGEGAEQTREQEIRSSFRSYLQTGAIETRDLTAANTGVAIPQLFSPLVTEAQRSYGEIYNLVDVMTTDTGNPMKIVFDDDTSNGLKPVTVGTDAANADPALTGGTLQVDNFTTGVVRVGYDLLSDSGFDVDAFIRDKFSKRFFRGASNLIVSGNNGSVQSLATAYSAGPTTATTNKLGYADLTQAIAALDPAYQGNASWAVSNAGLAYILGLVDANNRPLFLPYDAGATSGFVGSMLGRPVKLVTQLPGVATGNTPVLFGDFKAGYTFRQQKPGVVIQRLNERYAPGMEIGFVGFARVGGIAKLVAGSPAIVGITIK